MPTTNYDASELTRFRNARVLYNFNKQLLDDKINKNSIPEQGAPATQEVLVQRATGGMARIVDGKEQVAACSCT
jgi:hypothetical protein